MTASGTNHASEMRAFLRIGTGEMNKSAFRDPENGNVAVIAWFNRPAAFGFCSRRNDSPASRYCSFEGSWDTCA